MAIRGQVIFKPTGKNCLRSLKGGERVRSGGCPKTNCFYPTKVTFGTLATCQALRYIGSIYSISFNPQNHPMKGHYSFRMIGKPTEFQVTQPVTPRRFCSFVFLITTPAPRCYKPGSGGQVWFIPTVPWTCPGSSGGYQGAVSCQMQRNSVLIYWGAEGHAPTGNRARDGPHGPANATPRQSVAL